jgi:hypothetical protein
MSTDPNFDNFVGLSAILTGYTQDQLAPPVDPICLASEYLTWVEQHTDQAALEKTLTTFQNIAAQFPPPLDSTNPAPAQVVEISAAVQQQILSDPVMGPIARRIIRMWYLATWYTSEPPQSTDPGQVISMNAYTMGLAWDAAQAHPMGYSELHFGYWAMTPPVTDPAVSPNAFPPVNTQAQPTPEAVAVAEERPAALQRGGI